MKGFIPVDILTKKYIKAYLVYRLGEKPILSSDNLFGNKLYDLLLHQTNPHADRFANKRYDDILRVYIPMHVFRTRGGNLNEENTKNFNRFAEQLLKQRYYEVMDDCMELLPVFVANLPQARRKLGIDIEAWSDDSMKKDYYRYRKQQTISVRQLSRSF